MLAVRGRRQIGKSRLVEEFIGRSDVKALLVGVSRGGFGVDGLDVRQSSEDIVAAFSARP
jgi:AAA+ ATPase superfamily predicted ATPase